MPVTSPSVDPAVIGDLRALARELDVPGTWELPGLDRPDAAEVVDARLTFIARGRGALDVTIGELLRRLEDSGGRADLAYSNLGDYARERLDMPPRTALDLARLARALRTRPLLRAAVIAGRVSTRAAEIVVPVAIGDAEARWVAQAEGATVRALKEEIRRARGRELPDADEGDEGARWRLVAASLGAEGGEQFRRAVKVGRVIRGEGMAVPVGEIVGDMCMEWLGEFPVEEGAAEVAADVGRAAAEEAARDVRSAAGEGNEGGAEVRSEAAATNEAGADVGSATAGVTGADAEDDPPPFVPRRPRVVGTPILDGERFRAGLEEAMQRWPFLRRIEPVPAPESAVDEEIFADEERIDAELVRLARVRRQWGELIGHFGLLAQRCGVWRTAGFASFDHYCEERLGLAPSTIRPHIAMERRLWDLPPLRRALADGRIGFEKARRIASIATDRDVEAWIARAVPLTCVELERRVHGEEERRMSGTGEVRLRVPPRVARLIADAMESMSRLAGRYVGLEECLLALARHSMDTWKLEYERRCRRVSPIGKRDRGMCQAPGCSRPASEVHHLDFRSHGGSDDPGNLTCLCWFHHRQGIHEGRMAAFGRAPDGITWIMGRRAVQAWRAGLRKEVA